MIFRFMNIYIDNRETRLLDLFRSHYPNTPVISKALEIGDVLIEYEQYGIALVFERKTERDLDASIKDGRYREQKIRLLHTYPASQCMYIIESPGKWNPQNMSSSVFQGAIIHTMYRDGMHVVFTKNVEETAEWLHTISEKVREKPEKFKGNTNGGSADNYIDHVKIKKRKIENVDRNTCYLLQWAQIPGISSKLAQQIVAIYPSWSQFYRDMMIYASDIERVQNIAKIPGIGPKKAAHIWEYLKEPEVNHS